MNPLMEIIEKTKAGPVVEEKEFDMKIYQTAQKLVKKYDIRYDADNPVPSDDALAKRVFEAAIEFFVEVGVYCVNTRKIIKFSEDEVYEKIRLAPKQIVLGDGKDAVKLVPLVPDGDIEPVVCAGIQTALYSDEETMYKVYKGCAEDRCVDGIWGGITVNIDNTYDILAGEPSEIWAYRRSAVLLRKAIADAGRSGMFLKHNAPSPDATLACFDADSALRPGIDPVGSMGMSELKVSYGDLKRACWALVNNSVVSGGNIAPIGGWSGSVAATPIVAVAGAFQALIVHLASTICPGSLHMRYKSRAAREHIWVGGLSLQALSANSDLIANFSIGDHPGAGPGTEQYFYESGAGHIASTVSGGHSLGGTRKFVIGKTANFGTPIESRWMGEACKAAAGLSRKEANTIVNKLLDLYEPNLKDPPHGYVLEELYDVDTMTPNPHYVEMYNRVKSEVTDMGLDFHKLDNLSA